MHPFFHRLLVTVSLLGVACASPTLPLPPPGEVEASPPSETGLVTVTGDANDDAFVSCLNLDTERGVIVRTDEMGRFEVEIEGESGHTLELWQIVRGDSGEHEFIVVPEAP